MIWTEEQKTEMQRMRDVGISNADIGAKFNTSGDVIRKVLARFLAKRGVNLAKRSVKTLQERLAEHDLSAYRQCRALSGLPPLRIMPKDFQR